MLFSSSVFLLLFLPVVFLLYYLPFIKNRTYRNVLLLLASLFFYAWGEPAFVFLMLLSIIVNWAIGLAMDAGGHRKMWLVISVAWNLSLMFVFKYLTFVLTNIDALCGTDLAGNVSISLPLGISFFTFQILSYIFDLYYGRTPVQKRLYKFALYVSMFPQLVAGPIVRYEQIVDEIDNRTENSLDFSLGMTRFIYGLGKKVIFSNYMGVIADNMFYLSEHGSLSVGAAWIGGIAYTLQIYFDFSGYSDMAIGLGRIFGFHFLENFNYPYMAKSITDFWRRWHISLSQP
jgi:D-alanyl-lipoteichoic acid acyltransferase DltB (MBOAT superfamily)